MSEAAYNALLVAAFIFCFVYAVDLLIDGLSGLWEQWRAKKKIMRAGAGHCYDAPTAATVRGTSTD